MTFLKGNTFGSLRKNTKHSEETKKKISERTKEAMKNVSKEKLSFWKGKKMSEETRRKMSEKRRGENNNLWKGGINSIPGRRNWVKNKRNRMKRMLNKNGSFHTFGEWETLKAQYNWTCPSCKRSEPEISLTIDHIIPLSKGGSDNIENIQPLCLNCNVRKHTRIVKFQKNT